ncbi:MAG: immunoglobulin domain-containing protein [Chitinivibrionales bacterium]|nr:immunoglobulin domain-containing protein [Chitinivibrionales bacterium]
MTSGGTYSCKVTNAALPAGVTSTQCKVTVKPVDVPVSITQNLPGSLEIKEGESKTLTVRVDGSAPFSYTWYKNDAQVESEPNTNNTSSNYTINSEGTYYCKITNAALPSGVNSTKCKVTVKQTDEPVQITKNLPASLVLEQGKSEVITVQVKGTAPFTYTWYKDNTQIESEPNTNNTSSSYTVTGAGTYYCAVTNAASPNGVTSTKCQVTIKSDDPVSIVQDLQSNVTIDDGETFTLTVKVSGTAPYNYIWYKDGAEVSSGPSSETSSSYRASAAGDYYCKINNRTNSVSSNHCKITVNSKKPVALAQDLQAAITINEGDDATLTVSVTGSTPLTYTWYKDGTQLTSQSSSSTSSTYRIQKANANSGGEYYCTISNDAVLSGYNSVTSTKCKVTINSQVGVAITTDLAPTLAIEEGATKKLTVRVTGSKPVTFTWYKDGTQLTSQSDNTLNSSYEIANAQSSNAGEYHCVINNAVNSVTSQKCVVTVNSKKPVEFTQNLQSSATVDAGGSLTLTVKVNGTTPLTYTWYKDGNQLSTQQEVTTKQSSYQIKEAKAEDAGQYYCTVSNIVGPVTSERCQVTVSQKQVTITKDLLANLTLEVGASAALTIQVSGSVPLTYSWFKGDQQLTSQKSNELMSTYQITGAQESSAGEYYCTVSNSAGAGVTSTRCKVTVKSATPVSITQNLPASLALNAGGSSSLTVRVSGSTPFTYTWYKDNAQIKSESQSNQTQSTYDLTRVDESAAGTYYCAITNNNSKSEVKTQLCVVTVKVEEPVTIAQDIPTSLSIEAGKTASLTIRVKGSAPMIYTWYKDGTQLTSEKSDALQNSLTTTNAQPQDAGDYYCVIKNGGTNNSKNSVTSQHCQVTVTGQIGVSIRQDLNPTYIMAAGRTGSISVTVNGSTPLTYIWYKNGSTQVKKEENVTRTSSTLQFQNAEKADEGTYHCVISNSVGSATSAQCQVTVTVAGVNITANLPQNLRVELGGSASLNISISGSTPVTYTWYKNDAQISVQSNSNSLSSSLQIQNADAQDAGTYHCTITNSSNTVTSNRCAVTIISNPVTITRDLPPTLTIDEGEIGVLTVQVTGNLPITYTWYKNNAIISTQQINDYYSTLQIKNANSQSVGQYYCVMTNAAGSVTSQRCQVQIAQAQPVVITGNPVSLSQWERKAAAFAVTVTGSYPIKFQWYKDGVAIPNGTQQQLTILSITRNNAGQYHCVASNKLGSAQSASARLTVRQTAEITTHPPQTITKRVNESVSISVSAQGEQPINYVWQKYNQYGGSWTNVTASSTSPTMTIASVQTQHAGLYRCVAFNDGGQSISNQCELIVGIQMTVVKDLQDSLKAWSGKAMTLRFTVNGTGAIQYEWKKNGALIVTTREGVYTLPSCVSSDKGTYECIATDGDKNQVVSRKCVVTIGRAAMVTSLPLMQIVKLGATAQFSIVAEGDQPLWYQWQKDTVNLAGQTNAKLEITNVKVQDVGSYRCIATNDGGSDTSKYARLELNGPMTIVEQPVSATVYSGRKFMTRVVVTGNTTIRFQWQKNGVDVPGAIKDIFSIDKVSMADAGEYVCVISETGRSRGAEIRSAPAVLTVYETVNIVAPPISVKRKLGEKAVFSVLVNGQRPIIYQWQKNDIDIANARDSVYTINSVAVTDAGNYQCIVANAGDTIVSGRATLTVPGPAQFIMIPKTVAIWTGQTDSLEVQASGDDPMLYTWFKDSTNTKLSDTGRILIFKEITPMYGGKYFCIAENSLGKDTSEEITVSVLETVYLTKHPQTISVFEGNRAQFSVDVGGYGPFKYQWYFKQNEKDTFKLQGETSSELVFEHATKADEKNYYCIVINGGGAVKSQVARLTIENPGLLLMTPNGGEKWLIGQKKTIQWRFNGVVDSVKIMFSNVGGSNWSIIEEKIKNTGEYIWDVPYTISSLCKIKVSDVDNVPADESDNCFTIANITPIIDKDKSKKEIQSATQLIVTPNPGSRGTTGEVTFRLISAKRCQSAEVLVVDPMGTVLLRSTCSLISNRAGEPMKIAVWPLNRSGRSSVKVGTGTYLAIVRVRHSDGSSIVLRRLIGVKE